MSLWHLPSVPHCMHSKNFTHSAISPACIFLLNENFQANSSCSLHLPHSRRRNSSLKILNLNFIWLQKSHHLNNYNRSNWLQRWLFGHNKRKHLKSNEKKIKYFRDLPAKFSSKRNKNICGVLITDLLWRIMGFASYINRRQIYIKGRHKA